MAKAKSVTLRPSEVAAHKKREVLEILSLLGAEKRLEWLQAGYELIERRKAEAEEYLRSRKR
jgi:hypothetical protein